MKRLIEMEEIEPNRKLQITRSNEMFLNFNSILDISKIISHDLPS